MHLALVPPVFSRVSYIGGMFTPTEDEGTESSDHPEEPRNIVS